MEGSADEVVAWRDDLVDAEHSEPADYKIQLEMRIWGRMAELQ